MIQKKLSKEEFIQKLKNIKLVSIDGDGTLTDGSIYIDNKGNQLRKFCAHDGLGSSMLKELGIYLVLLTTSKEKIFAIRSDINNFNNYISGSFNKGEELEKLCKKLNISLEDTMHIGDDINDISAFLKVGLPVAVNNAIDSVKNLSKFITTKNGGSGAVREICDLIMIAKTGKPYGLPYVTQDLDNLI